MKLTDKQVKDIAEELLCGFDVYLNKETLEIKTIPSQFSGDILGDFWDKEYKEIEKEWELYIEITPMHSNDSFRVMEDFTQMVEDPELQKELTHRLNYKKPFANFKVVVESSKYRQNWFDFRQAKWEEYTREQLEIDDL